ncbi:MAG TPA: FCD domain-containing protein [Solirubrobacteraceae bacterium]|nr:FCD domain-containing protein [Solirubrobacteraceae bacterium]
MEGATALEAVFEPVHPATTFQETVERLGTAIRLGLLEPGVRLPPERELAEQLRISRSTLRQALTTLVQSGHLVSFRGRTGGTFVADAPPLSGGAGAGRPRPEWRGVLDHRVVVECGAALLAAERDGAALERMELLADQMDAADGFDAYRRADVRWHIALAEATGTPRLISAMTEVQGELTELLALVPHPPAALRRANDQHREIARLLRERDGGAAVAVLRTHLAETEGRLSALLNPVVRRPT